MRVQERAGRRGRRDCLVQKPALDESILTAEQNRNIVEWSGLPMFHLRHVTLGSLLAATSLSFALSSASAFACELSEPQKGTVAEVKDGETLALTDGTVVRLVNAKAPTAPIAARDDRP
jgi:hypothetical protein